MATWYLHNGSVYRNGVIKNEDIFIVDGKIAAFGNEAQKLRNQYQHKIQDINVEDCIISRGFIDLHTHLREPGFEDKETIASGTKAAAAGGFTSIYAMPNTNPPLDTITSLNDFFARLEKSAHVKVIPIASLTKGRLGKEVIDFEPFIKAGIKFFSDDGDPISDQLVTEAMSQLSQLGGVLINHLEDKNLVTSGYFHHNIPPESEYLMLERDLEIVKQTKCSYHAAHLSCAASVDLIAKAKAANLPVTAEVTPHHLVLTSDAIRFPEGHFQMKPPLRSKTDQGALIEGVKTGIIDIIATDHAPHGNEKANGLTANSPFGVTGLETAFPVLYSNLVLPGLLSLERLLELLSTAPAQLTGENSQLEIDQPADLVVIDLKRKQTVNAKRFLSKGTNSPFIGDSLTGWPILTLVNGKKQYSGDELEIEEENNAVNYR